VNLIVPLLVKTSNYWNVYFDLTEKGKKRFDAEGVTIPFSLRNVHVYERNPDKPEQKRFRVQRSKLNWE
jgi:small conductance mechanosensitive channel